MEKTTRSKGELKDKKIDVTKKKPNFMKEI